MLNKDDVGIVIYHRNCPDGFGSALAAKEYFKRNYPSKELLFVGANHGESPPPEIDGKNVLICDFSYKYPILLEMIGRAKNLLILDHHKSAEIELKDIPDDNKIFDMEHSGAYLTWKYFFPDEPVPELIQYIEDRDIWANKKDMYEEFSVWFQMVPFDFDEYSKYLDDELLLDTIKTKGSGMLALKKYNVESISKHACPKFCRIGGKVYIVAYINSNVWKSDVGNFVIDSVLPYADFCAVFSVDGSGTTYFSLRSTDKHVDVSLVAKKFGGGGHRNASGVAVSYPVCTLPGDVIDSYSVYEKLSNIYDGKLILGEFELNFVSINASFHRYTICKYLLQEKYTDEEKRSVSVAWSIIKRLKSIDDDTYKKYDISVSWSYNGSTSSIEYVFCLDDIDPAVLALFIEYLASNGTVEKHDSKYVKFVGKPSKISLF